MRETVGLCLKFHCEHRFCKCSPLTRLKEKMVAEAANDNFPMPTVILEDGKIILALPYQKRLQTSLIALDSGRRGVPTWIADAFNDFDAVGGQILYPDPKNGGRLVPLEIEDDGIDKAFGSMKDDHGSFRYISDWRGRDLKQRGQTRMLLRFQLLAAAFKIAYPCIAQHFAR